MVGAGGAGACLFVVGEAPLREDLRAAGFGLARSRGRSHFVVASFDRTFTYQKLQVAFDAIRAGARLVGTNPDRYCPTPAGGEPDAAAMIAAIEACTGVRCDPIVGQTVPIMVEMVLALLGLPAGVCMMVGDRLETDIAMGLRRDCDLPGADGRCDPGVVGGLGADAHAGAGAN